MSDLAINYTTQVKNLADGSSATHFLPAQGQWVKFLFYTGGCPAIWQCPLMCGNKGNKCEADLLHDHWKPPIYISIIYYIYPFPSPCCHNDPISPWGSLNFHIYIISSANVPLSRQSPPRHPPPTLRLIMSSEWSSSFLLPAAGSVACQFWSHRMTAWSLT